VCRSFEIKLGRVIEFDLLSSELFSVFPKWPSEVSYTRSKFEHFDRFPYRPLSTADAGRNTSSSMAQWLGARMRVFFSRFDPLCALCFLPVFRVKETAMH